jgi:hypothetical protein
MSKITKKLSTVSIVTITQFIRYDCLMLLYDQINLQTFKNISEWVIVEGSNSKEDAEKSRDNISKLITFHQKKNEKMKIIYVEYTGNKLSDLRNIGNTTCNGDIIVCMDDDDYYPTERIQHAVESLDKSQYLLAGCSDLYMFDYFLNKLYKFKGFHGKHSTNNCLAFKKEYLLNHKHESNLIMSEEKSFTNNFTEPMIQLNARKTIVVSSHDFNTFNKREICIGSSIGINPTVNEVENCNICDYIPYRYYKVYKKIFIKEEESPYDIVYLAGGFTAKWDSKSQDLGGSEQAIVNLSEYWATQNKKVVVYGDMLSGKEINYTHNGVDYKNWRTFPYNHKFKTLILWRTNGFITGGLYDVKADNIYWDLHDNFAGQDLIIHKFHQNKNKINKLLLKSNYHKTEFEKYFQMTLSDDKYYIIPNGVRVDKFSVNVDNVKRDPYRFCYVSYYSRGLQQILMYIWPHIVKAEPRCELHLYYGLDCIDNLELKNQLRELIGNSYNVIDHSRQPCHIIVREKYLSTFQLYITNTIAEIDCLSVKENLASGVVNLISNFGVFKERDGIHLNLDINENEQNFKDIAESILKLLKEPEKIEHYRKIFKKSVNLLSWSQTGQMLLDKIDGN